MTGECADEPGGEGGWREGRGRGWREGRREGENVMSGSEGEYRGEREGFDTVRGRMKEKESI